ncbi:MAG: hypothetical protein NC133_02695 [Prevotella sp.]|nr:hypothetical protein [Prevotella sp.]
MKVTAREQLFSTFNYTDDHLNPEFSDLLSTKANQLVAHRQQQFLIKIHTDSNEFEATEVAQCVHHHFHDAYDTAKRALKRLNGLAIIMMILGVFTLVLDFLAQNFADIYLLTEILNITDWVFVWEAVDIWFLRCPDARREAACLRALAFAEVSIAPDDHPLATTYIK